ncbi:ABC transporter ATP-binding protein [candidate division KSB1 bacterium]
MIDLNNLSLRFPNQNNFLLQNINLTLKQDSVIGLTGPSGGGKTLLGLVVSGVIPSFIQAEFEGTISKKIQKDTSRTQSAIVFQDPQFQLFSQTVYDELLFTPRNLGWQGNQVKEDLTNIVKGLNLEHILLQNPRQLSMGEIQRVALGAALMQRPHLLVLDEPTQYTDHFHLEKILKFVSGWTQKYNAAILLIEHHIPLLKQLCDKTYFLNKGILIEADLSENLFPEHYSKNTNSKEKLIQLNKINYEYQHGKTVLHDIDITIFRGESIAIIGPNGSGKSTLAKVICGLYKPSAGDIKMSGLPLSRNKNLYKEIGYVMQNPDQQIFSPTVKDECSFAPKNFGIPESVYTQRISKFLNDFQMKDFEDRDPFSLSYGEKRRLNIIGILAYQPEILILDEPTCALDFTNQKILLEKLVKIKNEGKTFLIITHDIKFAKSLCNRAVFLVDGKIAKDISMGEVEEKDVISFYNK